MEGAAEKTFRATVIETLLATPEFDTPFGPAPKVECNVLEILDGLLIPSEPTTTLLPVQSTDGELRFDEVNQDGEHLGTANVSMSLNRVPYTGKTSIKGSPNNVPFYPGGFAQALDNIMSFAKKESESNISANSELNYLNFTDLLNVPPGFVRSAEFPSPKTEKKAEEVISISENAEPLPSSVIPSSDDIFDLLDYVMADSSAPMANTMVSLNDQLTFPRKAEARQSSEENLELVSVSSDISEIENTIKDSKIVELPDVSIPQFHIYNKYAYASRIDCSAGLKEYDELRAHMARKYPFDLDPFQQAAVVHMEKGESIFVAAHTSAGKTVVAEYAVALCQKHKTKAIYTSPIKALSNQKFRDFKTIFEDVGLVTGDIQLFPEASCLIMTTEILRSMLYNGSEMVRDLEWVVFDEVHYINNAERGHVWEEVLIMLPAHVNIVMLSATVPNCDEFADWVGRIKNRRIKVVSTTKRPVPLEHFLYTGQDGNTKKNLFKVVDQSGLWNDCGFNKAKDAKLDLKAKALQAQGGGGGRGGGGSRGGLGRGGQNQRGGPQNRGGRGGGSGGNFNNRNKNDKNVYISLINHLSSLDQLPMVVFVFSRKRCDENAQLLSSMNLTTEMEKSQIHKFFAQCISRLKGSDKVLPQVLSMRELCIRGFAVHHSGILPILKEVVELLFQQGFVKILFATETFAMGVNMPARTVVFDSIQKHDGTQLRVLNAGEYIQMAGRAGRRGLDSTGMVVVLAKDQTVPDSSILKSIMQGEASKLESQFRVTYSMLLNLLRVEQLRIEDMLQRSFVECVSLRTGLDKKNRLSQVTEKLSAVEKIDCSICGDIESANSPLRIYHNALSHFTLKRAELWPKLAMSPAVDKLLAEGRLILVTSAQHGLSNKLAVLLKDRVVNGMKWLSIIVTCTEAEKLLDEQSIRLKAYEKDKQWLEEETLINSCHTWGPETPEKCSKLSDRTCRLITDIPITSLQAIYSKSLKINASELYNDASLLNSSRMRAQPLVPSLAKIVHELDSLSSNWSSDIQPKVVGVDVPMTIVELFEPVADLLSMRNDLLRDSFQAKHCPRITEHMKALRERVRIEREISLLKHQLSADALLLSEEYQNRLMVLKELKYVDDHDMVSFKGRVACEIHHQELLITELILENKLYDRSPAEVAAMLSSTTCQVKNQDAKIKPGTVFEKIKKDVEEVAERIDSVARRMRVNVADFEGEIRFDLMEVVYDWANGMAFSEIMQKTNAQEGLIVRCIQRLGEVCKDVRNAARIVGDPKLHELMEQVSAAIKRDIVFAASLYTSV